MSELNSEQQQRHVDAVLVGKFKDKLNKNKTPEEIEMKKLTSEAYYEEIEKLLGFCKNKDFDNARFHLKQINELEQKVVKAVSDDNMEAAKQIEEDIKDLAVSTNVNNSMQVFNNNLEIFAKEFGLKVGDLSIFKHDAKEIEERIELAWKAKMFDLTQGITHE